MYLLRISILHHRIVQDELMIGDNPARKRASFLPHTSKYKKGKREIRVVNK